MDAVDVPQKLLVEGALRRLPVGVDGRVELGEGRVAHERRGDRFPAGDEAEGQLGQACARMRLGVASMASGVIP